MSRWLLILALATASCTFQVNYDDSRYGCGASGECPLGHECVADFCVLPGGGDPPDATPPPDPPDAAVPDAPLPDAPPVPPPDAGPPDARVCEGGDDTVTDPETGHCYVLFLAPRNYGGALADCNGLGAQLAVVKTAGENQVVASLFATGVIDAWLGGNDSAVEMEWRWIDGTLVVFDNWRTGEPNNGGASGVMEDCMVMELDVGGTWDDRPCGNTNSYVCELP